MMNIVLNLVKDLGIGYGKLELTVKIMESTKPKDLHTRRRDVARVFMELATTNIC